MEKNILKHACTIRNIVFFAFYFLFILALSLSYNSADNDLWARLINGKHVFQTGFPMFQDVFSYIPTHTWFDPEWLSSCFIYIIQDNFGITGLFFLKAFSVFFILLMLFYSLKFAKKIDSVSPIFYLYFLHLFLVFGLLAWVRCQVITFFLIPLWLLLLEKARKGEPKFLLFLPLIMLFWLNTHGGCIAGVGILFLYLIGQILAKKPFKNFLIAFIVSCLVFLINPWGIDYIQFMFHSAFVNRDWISEWQNTITSGIVPDITKHHVILVFLSLFAYIYKIFKFKIPFSNLNKTKILVTVVVCLLSFKTIKHVALSWVVLWFYFYDEYLLLFKDILEALRKRFQISLSASFKIKTIFEIIICAYICVYSITVFSTKDLKQAFFDSTLQKFPIYEAEFIKENKLKGTIISSFGYGSYLAYKLYPDVKIFMDGRQEQVYDDKMIDYLMYFYNQAGKEPDKILELYPADYILTDKDNDLLIPHLLNVNYSLIYNSKHFALFVKKEKEKFSYEMPKIESKFYIDHIFDNNLNFKCK